MCRVHATPDEKYTYGLTMRMQQIEGHTLFGHHGYAPPYCSGLFVDPTSGYGVTVMMNTDCSKLRDRILETVFAELITG